MLNPEQTQQGADDQFNEELRKMRAGILDSGFDIRKVRLENQIMELFMKFEKMQSEEEIMEEMNRMAKNH